MTIHRFLQHAGTLLLALSWPFAAAQAQPAPESFTGKTLTIIVGVDAGGTVDTFVRLLAPHLKKHVPGNPAILVQNMLGAGGLVATNFLAERAAKDGLTIGYQNWDPLAQALGNQGLRTRYDRFEYLGGTSDTRVNYARVDSIPGGIKTPADIVKAQGIAVGAYSNTDISGLLAKMSLEVMGVPHKFITGYRGGQDIFLALQRGEVQYHNTSITSFRTRAGPFVKSGIGTGISYLNTLDAQGRFEPNRDITEMPAFTELYAQINGRPPSGPSWDALSWLVQVFGDVAFMGLAPPGTAPAALTALRRGFEGAILDPEFVEQSTRINGLPYPFVPVERGRAIIKALADVSPAVLDTVRRSIGEVK